MKKLFAFVVAMLMIVTVCHAKVTDLGYLRVEISENIEIANTFMNIEVYAPDTDFSDLEDSIRYSDVLVFSKVVKTDENGNISLKFKVTGENPKSGLYTVKITGEDYYNIEKIVIANTVASESIIADINETIAESDKAVSTAKIANYIENNYYDLYIAKKEYVDSSASDKAAALVYEYLDRENISLSLSNVSFVMNKAVAITALEDGKVSNIISDAESFCLNNGELADWYTKYYVTTKTGERMKKRLENKKFNSFEKFDVALLESFILSVVEKPDGVDNVRALMKRFSDEIGISSSGSEKQYIHIMNKNFDTFADLAYAFNNYKSESSGGGNGGGGGGGSSSGSSKGDSVTTVPSVAIESPATDSSDDETYPITIFSDLYTVSWAEEAIIALAENGILNGKGENLFCPNDNITREEFTAILVRALIPNQQMADINFIDTDKEAWYYEFLQKAVGAAIVQGKSSELFGVGENITRQDMAVMINRAGAYISNDFSRNLGEYEKFSDDTSISDYAKEAVYRLKLLEIINGVDGENFAPKAFATRAEAAKMMYGILQLQGGV